MQSITRSARDAVVRVGLADAAFWVYGQATRLKPSTLVLNTQYRRRGAPDGLPIPPANLIFLVAGTSDISWFLRAGALAATSMVKLLGENGVPGPDGKSILDFGCGCGRVTRWWKNVARAQITGTDYNPRLVDWDRQNLPFAKFDVNGLNPPLSYPDRQFDLVYALSVFTHLTEPLQKEWMAELTRVVRPGGHLIISAHGETYIHRLNETERARFESSELVVKNNVKSPGSNTCSAYHPPAYVRTQLARELEVVDFRPEGALGNPKQDLYLLRRPA